jgi:hypothetical protein
VLAASTAAPWTAPSRRRGIHPRDYYLGVFNASCVRPSRSVDAEHLLRDINAVCFSGYGVRVAVLDTGLCRHVSAWSSNEVTCTSLVPGVACDDAGCGHGTRSVSVLAGHLCPPAQRGECYQHAERTTSFSRRHYIGMAPRAHVHAYRVFDRGGNTHTRYVAGALDLLLRDAEAYHSAQRFSSTAEKRGMPPATPPPVDIVSLSYGGEDYYGNAVVQSRLHRLMHDYGVLIVAAAGNDQYRFGSVRSPADMPGVLAVGAMKLTLQNVTQGRAAEHPPSEGVWWNGVYERAVAGFSGRGPTTWELPLGAGRIKPDVIALGQHVWAAEGVSSKPSRGLRLRAASGTSVAAPIAAGVAALLFEGVWWERQRRTGEGMVRHSSAYWANRLHASLRVRQLLLSTAEPLAPIGRRVQQDNTEKKPATGVWGGDGDADAAATDNTELAGLPLTRLYSRYLQLTRWSILSQGVGELQPRRALATLLSAAALPSRRPPRVCDAFSIPPSLHVGGAPVQRGGECDDVVAGGRPPHLPTLWKAPTSEVYWWPYSDVMMYAGAVPVLFNFSVHLCPFSTEDNAENNRGPQLPPSPQSSSSSLFPLIQAPGQNSGISSRKRTYDVRLVLTEVVGHLTRRKDPQGSGKAARHVVVLLSNNSSNSTDAVKAPRSSLQRLLQRHLLRAALKLRETAAPPVPPLLPEQQQGQHDAPPLRRPPPSLPLTDFTLSTAFYVPPTAHTRLRYCTNTSSRVSSAACDHHISDIYDDDKGRRKRRTSGRDGSAHSRPPSVTEPATACVPLFHAFAVVEVTAEIRVHACGNTHRLPPSSSPVLLAIPVFLRIHAPPPRALRVLVDTSLDWFNPTAASADFFIPGNDPHEAAAQSPSDREGGGVAHRSYAEVGGDHPHTNLALLYVYLRHSLGLAVTFFPLLHTATAANAFAAPTDVAAAATTALSAAGTVIFVDPERPLTRSMQALLTAAVQPASDRDGLGVVVTTDWHSAEVAAALRWARDVSSHSTRTKHESRGRDEAGSTLERAPNQHSGTHPAKSAERKLLRAWRVTGRDNGSRDDVHAPSHSTRGLRGSCHVLSWNRWFAQLTVAAAAPGGRGKGVHNPLRGSTQGEPRPPRPPFLLSEEVVMDGVVVVAATTTAAGHTTAIRNGSVGLERQPERALRSIGQLNAAGILQWASPYEEPQHDAASCTRHDVTRRRKGMATFCNVMPAWADAQHRLHKRVVARSAASLSKAEEEDVVYVDTWETLAASPAHTCIPRPLGHIGRVAVSLPAAGSAATSCDASADAAGPPSRGIFGFLELPPTPPELQGQRGGALTWKPGRVAVFTDSNCFSTEDPRLQHALLTLDHLTQAGDTASHELLNTAAGQLFVRKESAQSSTCVEVMKELLHWTHTGNGKRWWADLQLHCESRAWPSWLHQHSKSNSNSADDCAAPADATDDVHDGEDDEDLLHLAPERASVGVGVTQLWIATILSDSFDDSNASSGAAAPAAPCPVFPVCAARPSHPSALMESTAVDAMSRELAERFAEQQAKAEQEALRSLSVVYHGDWASHGGGRGHASHDQHRNHNDDSPAHIHERDEGDESSRHLSTHVDPVMAAPSRRGHVEGSQAGLFAIFGWLGHPVVVGQSVLIVALAVGYGVYTRVPRTDAKRARAVRPVTCGIHVTTLKE